MPSVVKTNNNVQMIINYRDSLSTENIYLFFGKNSEWSDEDNPDTPVDSVDDDISTRESIIGIKKITLEDTCFAIPRINWTSNTQYSQYSSSDEDLFNDPLNTGYQKNFYVLNSNNNVYKCLNNNSGGNSTVEPSGTSINSFTTGDGYEWKFMYNISTSLALKFLTDNWMPVPTNGQKTAQQELVESNATFSLSNGDPVGGHGASAIHEFGSNRLMLSQSLIDNEGGELLTSVEFRQYGIWVNPLTLSGEQPEDLIYMVNTSGSEIDEMSGRLLFIDNIEVINRSAIQIEKFIFLQTFV